MYMTRFICGNCKLGFGRQYDMQRHKCNAQPPRYGCTYCHKRDNSSSNIKRHIRRWHPDYPIKVDRFF
uniref:C2H2-type domain-containing protein n=2 Tax=Trichogramma TaxID=7490 RepID=A0ABD2WU08_9HYME